VTGRVKGMLYNGPLDCLWKTFKAEGIAGWYKGMLWSLSLSRSKADLAGTTAHFFRIFPHTVVTLVANEVCLSQRCTHVG
jgi:solute carrier family 25 protein 34/35